ncbi:MAG: S9 family peptidase [Gemmatimonadetes bacterium]|nr:S9 family peptidase [Gemmatimonadota bacterium]
MRLHALFAAGLLAAAPATLGAQASPRPFVPGDWYRVTTLSNPAVSPDGKVVAVTVTTVNERENRRHAEVWTVPASGGEPVRWTSPGTESSNPRFTPDGKYLLFTSPRPGGTGNTWAIRLDQPGGEAAQLEKYPVQGSTPRDGRFAAWAEPVNDSATAPRPDPRWERMPPMARPPYNAITQPLDAARFDGRHMTEMRYKFNGTGFIPGLRTARRWNAAQVWTQKFDGSDKVQLTGTAYSHRDIAVSPDGNWIAFTADSRLRPDSVVQAEQDSLGKLPYSARRDEAPRNDLDIFVIAATGGEPRRVTSARGNEASLEWSPDGRLIAFIASTTRTSPQRLWVVDAGGGAPRDLLGTWRYEPTGCKWQSATEIAFNAEVGGRSGWFRVPATGGTPRELIGGRRRMTGFAMDEARSKVAFVATSQAKPTELFIADADGRNERRLTAFNDKLNAEVAWADADVFTFRSVGGREIEGWLMKPAGYEAGKKYPLVLYIHGGPHSAYGENWFDEFQNLAGAGFMVLFTNPRGSAGYGADFTFSIRGKWMAEDYQDLMKAVDLVSVRADVDSTRMGVTGGSYGGVMTAWITSHTNRFKAAENDRMISNFWSWYGTSDAAGLTEFEYFGRPWDNMAMYDSTSPIRYAPRVRTPTLIVQSEEDHRTPMTDAEQWYMALKKHGTPVEMVRYPRSTHDLSRTGEPWLLVDRLGRIRQWFGYWLQGKQPAGPPARATTSGKD